MLTRTILSLAMAAALVPAMSSTAQTADTISIATFNVEFLIDHKVHMKFGLPFSLRGAEQSTWNGPGYRAQKMNEAVAAVADYIVTLDADIVVLQEIGDQEDLAQLLEALDKAGARYPHSRVSDTFDSGTGQHVAVLSRRRFQTVEHDGKASIPGWETYDEELDDTDTESETQVTKGMHVRLEVAGRPLNLIVLHLKSERGGHESDAKRIAQANIVRRYTLPYLDKGEHVIIAGDLNDRRGQPAIKRIRGQDDVFEDLLQTGHTRFFPRDRGDHLGERYTYTYMGSRGQIDHILISRSIIDACGERGITPTFHAVPSELVSDHRPLVVRFDFARTTGRAARN